jgi:hypothetical protein
MMHLSGAPLLCRLLTLLANITQGWKGLPETNTKLIWTIRLLRRNKRFLNFNLDDVAAEVHVVATNFNAAIIFLKFKKIHFIFFCLITRVTWTDGKKLFYP